MKIFSWVLLIAGLLFASMVRTKGMDASLSGNPDSERMMLWLIAAPTFFANFLLIGAMTRLADGMKKAALGLLLSLGYLCLAPVLLQLATEVEFSFVVLSGPLLLTGINFVILFGTGKKAEMELPALALSFAAGYVVSVGLGVLDVSVRPLPDIDQFPLPILAVILGAVIVTALSSVFYKLVDGSFELVKTLAKIVFAIAVSFATFLSYAVQDAASFQKPELARIFFWHFPCPIMATGLICIGAWFSFKYLQTKDLAWDARASATNELGYIFCLATMTTGILFSYVQWGDWWQWDPRQTSFLIVLLIYLAYFVLRGAMPDEDRRAANSGAYALAALGPALFLIFVFPRLPQIAQASFHPTKSIMAGEIKGYYAYVISATMTLSLVFSVWLYKMRVAASLFEQEVNNNDGTMETNRITPTPTGVVRPVRVPDQD